MVPGVAKVPFISVGAIIEVDLAQDSHILKKLEGAVDCDKAYIRLRPRYRLEHLLCRQMSGAVLKEKKDQPSLFGQLASGVSEYADGIFIPVLGHWGCRKLYRTLHSGCCRSSGWSRFDGFI